MQVCWVCISGRPSAYAAGTGLKLPRTSGSWRLVGAVHCSRYVRISGDSSYSVRTSPWVGAAALEPDPVVALDQPAGEPLHLGQRAVGPLLVADAGRTR